MILKNVGDQILFVLCRLKFTDNDKNVSIIKRQINNSKFWIFYMGQFIKKTSNSYLGLMKTPSCSCSANHQNVNFGILLPKAEMLVF
jgi:hypothetical protein